MNDKDDIRTLCNRCRQGYTLAGFILHRTENQIKDSCMICGRPGWDYIVEDKPSGTNRKMPILRTRAKI